MRVSKSAIGSLMLMFLSALVDFTCQPPLEMRRPLFFFVDPAAAAEVPDDTPVPLVGGSITRRKLPTGFNHTRQLSLRGHIPKADTANTKLSDERSGSAAQGTPVIGPDLELRFTYGFNSD